MIAINIYTTINNQQIDERLIRSSKKESGDTVGSLPDILGSPRSTSGGGGGGGAAASGQYDPVTGRRHSRLIDDDKQNPNIKTPHGFVASDRRNSVSIMRRAQSQPKLVHAQSEPGEHNGGDMIKLKDRASSTHNLVNKNSDSNTNTSPSQPEPKLATNTTSTTINSVTSNNNKAPFINANVFVAHHNKRKSKELIGDFSPNSSARGIFQYPQDSNNNNNNNNNNNGLNIKDDQNGKHNSNNNNNKGNTHRPYTPMSLASNTATEDGDRSLDISGDPSRRQSRTDSEKDKNNNNNVVVGIGNGNSHHQPQTVPENAPLNNGGIIGSGELKEIPYLNNKGIAFLHEPGSNKVYTSIFVFLTLILWVFSYRLFNHESEDGSIRLFPVTNGVGKILFGIWEIIHFISTFGSIMAVHRGCTPGAFNTRFPYYWIKVCAGIGLIVFISNIIRLASDSCDFEIAYQIIKKVSIIGGMIIPYYLHLRWRMSSLQWLIFLFWMSKILMDYTSVIEHSLTPELIYFLFYGVCLICWIGRTYIDRKYFVDSLGNLFTINDAGFTALLVACALIIPQVGGAFLVTISAMDNNVDSNSNDTIFITFIIFIISKCTFWIVRSLWEYAAFQATDQRRYGYLMFPILFCEEMIDALLLICIKFEWYWFILLILISINNILRNSDILHNYIYVKKLMIYFSSTHSIHQRESSEERLARIMVHNDMLSFCEWLARGSLLTVLITDWVCDSLNIGDDLILNRVPETRQWAIFVAILIACAITCVTQISV